MMNAKFFREFGLLIFWISLTLVSSNAQTFYQTYPAYQFFPSSIFETVDGFEIDGRQSNFQSADWNILTTESNGELINGVGFSLPIDESASTIRLSDGTFFTTLPPSFPNLPSSQFFTHMNQQGTVLHDFEFDFPTGVELILGAKFVELPDGTIFIVLGYTVDEFQGNATDKYNVFIHYDLANQTEISQQTVIRNTFSFRTHYRQLVPAADGNVFLNLEDDDPVIRHRIFKLQTDGTEIWQREVSTLERPASIKSVTLDGGLFYEVKAFELFSQLDANGDVVQQGVKNALQNLIQGPIDIRGMVLSPSGSYALVSRGCPTNSNCQLMTTLISSSNEILQNHLYEIITDFPTNFTGIALTNGGYAFTGEFDGGTPVILRLDENAEFDPSAYIDLDLAITGTTSTPPIYTNHSVTITINNTSNTTATGVSVSIPEAAGEVYSGGNAYSASQGSFSWWGDQIWTVGTLAGGASASITINYFKLSDVDFFQYGEVASADQDDIDSAPNNGNGNSVEEDDEVTLGAGAVDIFAGFNFTGSIGTDQGGTVTMGYSYFLTNEGDVSNPLVFTNTIYLSTDNVFSNDDVAVFDDPQSTTTTSNGRTVDVTLPNSVQPGLYYVFIKMDDKNDYIESNEDNNVTSATNIPKLVVTPPGNGQADLIAGYLIGNDATVNTGQNVFGGGYTMYNTGGNTNTQFVNKFYLSTDQSLSNDDILAGEYQMLFPSVLDQTPQSLSVSLTIPGNTPSGLYYILIDVDGNDNVAESYENNNVRSSVKRLNVNGTSNPCTSDIIPPVISNCPSDITETIAGNSTPIQWTVPSVSDNCTTDLSLMSSDDPGDVFGLGSHTVTYNVQDEAGNTATCTFTITIVQDGGSGTCATNLLQNSGFENNFVGWVNRGGGSITNDAYEGNKAVKVCNVGESRVLQVANIVGGKTYDFEFTGKNEGGGIIATGNVYVKFLTASWQPIAYSSYVAIPGEWQTVTSSVVAPANAVYAELNISAGSNYCVTVDNVCLSERGTTGGNDKADLVLANLSNPGSGAAGDVIYYNFDLSNIGTAAANGNFSIKAYFSTDNVLSNDDIQDGTVPTGNIGTGVTINNVPGASTVPSGLAAGTYYLILKVDADEQINELNENNNTISRTVEVTGGGNGTPIPCDLSYTTTGTSISVTGAGLNAGHIIVKLFDPSWATVFNCLDNCGNPMVISGLSSGEHHLSVALYNNNWQATCNTLVDIMVSGTTLSLVNQNRGILYLDAYEMDKGVRLNWVAKTDSETAYFEVERSIDGETFELIEEQSPLGNGLVNYQFQDAFPVKGTNYYRITQVLEDGSIVNSRLKQVDIDADPLAFTLYPNPVRDELQLSLKSLIGDRVVISIFDQLGNVLKVVEQEEVDASAISILVNDLTNGMYFLSVQTENRKAMTKRFVVEH